tara:strand:- start:4720 stop:4983 length:264 start_codon:yes stop_codon:yes gene_type:complete
MQTEGYNKTDYVLRSDHAFILRKHGNENTARLIAKTRGVPVEIFRANGTVLVVSWDKGWKQKTIPSERIRLNSQGGWPDKFYLRLDG